MNKKRKREEAWNKVIAILIIHIFIGSIFSHSVNSASGFNNENNLQGDEYAAAYSEWLTTTDPDNFQSDDWNSVPDLSKVKWGDIDDFTKVPMGKIPVENYKDIKWGKVDKTKLREINQPAQLTALIKKLSEDANREQLKKLSSAQLAQGNSLELVGDLNSLDQVEMNNAFKQLGLIPQKVNVVLIPGVKITYKDGVIYNEKFKPKGFAIARVKNNPDITLISAVTDPNDPGKDGFVLCKKEGECQTITSKDVGAITGIDINEEGDTIVFTSSGQFTLKKGQLDAVVDSNGNAVMVSEEGTFVVYNGIDFIAHGDDSGKTKFTFNDKDKFVSMNGPGYVSRGKDSLINQKIEGQNFYGEFKFKFGSKPGDFKISAERAHIKVGEDVYSGSFSADYESEKLMEFGLNEKGSYAEIRGHQRLTNKDGIKKRYVTQYNKDGKTIEQIWHNTVTIQTLNEERNRFSNLDEKDFAEEKASTIRKLDSQIEQIKDQIKKAPNDIQKAQLRSQIEDLEGFKSDIETISSIPAIQTYLNDQIFELEDQIFDTNRQHPNTGYLEYYLDDKTLYVEDPEDVRSGRMVILTGKSTYGTSNDQLTFSGSQEGVYSIFSPRLYSPSSGKEDQLTKKDFIYFQAGSKEQNGDFGTAKVKTKEDKNLQVLFGKSVVHHQ